MAIIIPANSAAVTAYSVDNSCRFNDGDSPRMHKTQGDGNQDKWTFSAWIKRGVLGEQYVFRAETDGSNYFHIRIESDNQIYCSGVLAGSNNIIVEPSNMLRDVSAWYHIVLAVDTGQATDTNRVKWWINGTQVTSFSRDTYPAQNADTLVNDNGGTFTLGSDHDGGYHFDGYMAEVCLIDNAQLDADSFGEFDSDSPTIWKPKDVSGLTFGTNGFYLDFKDSANLGNDANGGTDLTEANLAATDQATDTPTNNFCTLNSVELSTSTSVTVAEGNTELRTTTAGYRGCYATMGFKYGFAAYWEVKIVTAIPNVVGLSRKSANEARGDVITGEETEGGSTAFDYMYQPANANNVRYKGTSQSVTIAACSAGDIVAFSVSSSGVVKIYLNDSLVHTYSTALQTAEESDRVDNTYFPVFAVNAYTASPNYIHVNFGSPTYANSSSQSDPDGYGDFEYATKSGYALCTKNLGAYGG